MSGRFLPPLFDAIERRICGLTASQGVPMGEVPLTGRPADKAWILNQSWRRSDWRFLTLHPWPQRSLCFGDDSLARSLMLISGSLAVNRPAPEGSCDLAALQDPTDATLYMALQALAPTGALYVEFSPLRSGRGRGPLKRAREVLAAAGFVDVQFFVPYPNLEMARVWLPLNQADAVSRYLAAQRFPRSRLAQSFSARLVMAALRFEQVPGLCAIARKDSGRPTMPGSATMRGDILDLGRDAFDCLARASGGDYTLLLSSSAGDDGIQENEAEKGLGHSESPMTGLVFTPDDADPQWVLKMARIHEEETALRSEQQVLERLERVTSGNSSPVRLPRVLFLRETNPGVVLCETAIHGLPLSELLNAGNFSLYAERLTNLQISLARRTQGTSPLGASQVKIEKLVTTLAECLPETALKPAEIARLRQVFSTLANLPIVCAHNNFAPWNVRLDGSRLGLLHWREAEWSGLPMLDLVYMLSQMTFLLKHVRGPEQAASAYRAMLDPHTRPGQVAQECIFRYTHSLGLPSGLIPALRLLTWTQQAALEIRRQQQKEQGQVLVDWIPYSQSLALLREELQEQVLPAWEGE